MRRRTVLVFVACLLAVTGVRAQPVVAPDPAMKKLAFLIGTWRLDVAGLNLEGEVIHRSSGQWVYTREMGGLLIIGAGYAEDGRLAARSWKFRHNKDHELYDVQFDLAGNFEVRKAVATDPNLAFSLVEPFVAGDGIPRDWRKTYRIIDADAFEVETHYTEDGGRSWILAFRERQTRVSRDRGASARPGSRNAEGGWT